MSVTSLFSIFGGKGRLIHLYRAPQHDSICEPFGGAASYSCRYWERDCHVNDLDVNVYSIYQLYQLPNAADLIENYFPADVIHLDQIEEVIDVEAVHPGLVQLVMSFMSLGTYPVQRTMATPAGSSKDWTRRKKQVLEWVPRVRHWTFTNMPYATLPGIRACWFVDPPYQKEGHRYPCGSAGIDYGHLREWAFARRGQVTICESEKNDWLPEAKRLTERRRGFYFGNRRASTTGEVVYER